MKKALFYILIVYSFANCNTEKPEITQNKIEGTWKMVYAETIENDSIKLKDLTETTFIKIINKTHFSFFNQENSGTKNFYGGAGTYTLEGDKYTETLNFTSVEAIKKHKFPFNIRFSHDTLIQSGVEKVKAAGINRYIIEKYIKLN